MMRMLFKELIEELIKWLKKMWFDAKLKARLDKIERDYKIKFEKDLKECHGKKQKLSMVQLLLENG